MFNECIRGEFVNCGRWRVFFRRGWFWNIYSVVRSDVRLYDMIGNVLLCYVVLVGSIVF